MKGVGGAAAGPQKGSKQDTPNKQGAGGADSSVEFKSIKDIAAAFNNNPIPTNPAPSPPAASTPSTSTSNPLSAITNNIKEAVLSITPFTKDKDKDNKETKDKDQKDNKEHKDKDKDNKDKDRDKDNKDKDNKDKEGKDKSPTSIKASAEGNAGGRRVIGGAGKEPSTLQVNPLRYVIILGPFVQCALHSNNLIRFSFIQYAHFKLLFLKNPRMNNPA